MAHDGTWKRLGDGSLLTEDADEGLGHIVPFKVYMNILIALIILTGLTVYTAKYIDLGDGNIVLAMVLATIKAALVMAFFMHVKFEGKLVLAFVFYPFIILFLLIGGSYMDIVERVDIHTEPAFESPGFTDEVKKKFYKKHSDSSHANGASNSAGH